MSYHVGNRGELGSEERRERRRKEEERAKKTDIVRNETYAVTALTHI